MGASEPQVCILLYCYVVGQAARWKKELEVVKAYTTAARLAQNIF